MYQTIKTDKIPTAIGPYSQAVSFNEILFIFGQRASKGRFFVRLRPLP